MDINPIPANKDKILFWVILAFTSTCFAEIPAASTLFPLFDLWGFFVVFPLYGLHILVLASFLFRRGHFRWQRLYLVGILFGLYEAYITKIIWNPGWEPLFPSIAQVYPFELLVICFFWHPFFSFFIPLLLCETFLTDSKTIFCALPLRLQNTLINPKRLLLISAGLAIFTGGFQTLNSPSAVHSLSSGLVNGVILIGLFWIWRRRFLQEKPGLPQLLPEKTAFRWFLGSLFLLYFILGLFLQRQAFPGWMGHLSVWIIYGIVFGLIFLDQKKDQPECSANGSTPQPPLGKFAVILIIFSFSAALIKLFLPTSGPVFMILGWLGMALSSLFLFSAVIISSIKRNHSV